MIEAPGKTRAGSGVPPSHPAVSCKRPGHMAEGARLAGGI
jgi:hypothetical protein